jgi:hypothetical protein
VNLKQLDEVVLFLPAADALEIEDFAKVCVVAVGNVD